MPRAAPPLLAMIGVLACFGSAHAEPGPRTARLIYTRGVPECPDETVVRNEVMARLGYDPFTANAKRTVAASISRARGGLRARIDLEEGTTSAGSRTLDSTTNDCSELASAMILALSIAIDPTSLTRPPPPPPPKPDPPETPPPASSHEKAEPAPEHAANEIRAAIGVLGGAGFGLTPGASFAPRVMLGIESQRWAVDVEGRFLLPSEASSGGQSVRASLFLGALAPCYRGDLAPSAGISGRACAVVAMGRMTGTGKGVDVPLEDTSFYAAAGPRAALELALGRSAVLILQTDVLAPLGETRLRLNGTDVWRSSAIAVDVAAGAIARFP